MYKTVLISCSLVCILLLCTAGIGANRLGMGTIWLSPQEHDFGSIPLGKPVSIRFVFQNTGSVPLTIDNVRTPCGCTPVEWPDVPVAPGSTASVTVEYNAAQSGYFYKVIKVFFRGTRGADRLVVKGTVE